MNVEILKQLRIVHGMFNTQICIQSVHVMFEFEYANNFKDSSSSSLLQIFWVIPLTW